MTNDEMRGADGPPDNAQKVRPDTRKRRDEKQKRTEKNSESKKKKCHPSCVCVSVCGMLVGVGGGVGCTYVRVYVSCFPCCRSHVYLWYCSRSGLDALTSFASLRKKIGWWGSYLVFLFLFLLFVSSGSSFLPVCQLFLVFV
ncbi:hypothetical protein BDP55DRAFT_356527 [Colletotrichum godetiae]|uniref:Uncharacterized protein n=1 Tax=Colletotrichum godetiae TaxID=1209918 RepID=A0AAJ0ABG7_9PEZI|nr:uncharacterized protein BDP55DRAFT_356527 [Colletotrichum godetiae]KAK1659453.1 hypothetical protein BDP55DRAFT_356527 [Colletotrichum godetiae]